MTSSYQGPTTVRSSLYHQHPSSVDQQVPYADDTSDGDDKFDTSAHSHHDLGQPLTNVNAQFFWPCQNAQSKATWPVWPHGAWGFQASSSAPEAGQISPSVWEAPVSHTYTHLQFDHGEDTHADQHQTNGWLLQRSYRDPRTVTNQSAHWGYLPSPTDYWIPHYTDTHQHSYGPTYETSEHSQQHNDVHDEQPNDMSVSIGPYPLPSPEDVASFNTYYTEEKAPEPWAIYTPTSKQCAHIVPQPGNYVNDGMSSSAYTLETGWLSNFPDSSPTAVKASNNGAGHSPSPSILSMDDSIRPKMAFPSDLIPELPTTLIDPPAEDMNPTDKSLVPQRRNLKDQNHLYMPRWTRGHGKQREGWCGACRPGKWLSLKRSTYWYHKNFCHGITVLGTAFPRPKDVRQSRDEKGWEGLCGSCGVWVTLNGGKKSHTSWFRHAYKCDSSTQTASLASGAIFY